MIFAPELNLAILENCTSKPREQQVWTYRFGETPTEWKPSPSPPRAVPPLVEDGVVSVIGPQRVDLSWSAPVALSLPDRDGRARDRRSVTTDVDRANNADRATAFVSRSDTATWRYHVERATVEVYSDDQLARLRSRTPPMAEPTVGAIRRIGPFTRLTKEPLKTPEFNDTSINLNEPQTIEDARLKAELRT